MRLGVKLGASLAALVLALGGVMFWSVQRADRTRSRQVQELRQALDGRERALAELGSKYVSVAAKQAAVEASDRAVAVLAAFVKDKDRELDDPAVLRALASGRNPQGVAAGLLEKSRQPLDMVIVTDAKGRVTATAPPSEAMTGKGYLSAQEFAFMKGYAKPRYTLRLIPGGQGRALSGEARFRRGSTFRGIVIVNAALDALFKEALEAAGAIADAGLLVVDKRGVLVFAPSSDLINRPFAESLEFQPLVAAPARVPVELKYNLGRWIGYKQPAALDMTIIGLGAVGAAGALGPPDGAGGAARAPWVLLGGAVGAGLIAAMVLVFLVVRRIRRLGAAAEALSSGGGSVEVHGKGANDELGGLAKSLESLGEHLAEERRKGEENERALGKAQQELSSAHTEIKEIKELQASQEAKSAREKEALETNLQTVRGELEGVRGELGGAKNELEQTRSRLSEHEKAVAERDQALATVNAQLEQLQAERASLQQSLAQQGAELANVRSELERKAAAPVAGFTLLSEASDALTVEISSLVDLVQGYVGQIIESSGGAISDEQQEFLTSVINRSARSQRMLGELRDFSNISRPGGMATEPVDLVALLHDVVSTIQPAAEEKGLEFSGEVPDSLPEARGDEARLRQLFTVILQNAVRFTPEGGRVSLTVAMKDNVAGVRIEDGAEPIPMKSEDVFGHFHPSDEEILELRGSGLRYPILRAIAEYHGGAVDLAINEQGGNLFFIRVPVRGDAPSAEDTLGIFSGVSSGEAQAAALAAAGLAAQGEAPAPPPSEPPAGEAFGLAAEPTPESAPSLELSADLPAPGGVEAPPAQVETTDSILAAEPEPAPAASAEPPSASALDALFPVPDPPSPEAGPAEVSLDLGTEGAASAEPAPPSLEPPSFEAPPSLGEIPAPGEAGTSPPPADAPAGEGSGEPGPDAPSSFSFGSDEIIQE